MALNCDARSLANAARCFDSCVPNGLRQSLKTYLLCQIANGSIIGSGNHILAETGDILATEDGLELITES